MVTQRLVTLMAVTFLENDDCDIATKRNRIHLVEKYAGRSYKFGSASKPDFRATFNTFVSAGSYFTEIFTSIPRFYFTEKKVSVYCNSTNRIFIQKFSIFNSVFSDKNPVPKWVNYNTHGCEVKCKATGNRDYRLE